MSYDEDSVRDEHGLNDDIEGDDELMEPLGSEEDFQFDEEDPEDKYH